MFSRALLVAVLCAAISIAAAAETVTVKYRGPVPLDTFQCATIDRSSLVERVCYDAAGRTDKNNAQFGPPIVTAASDYSNDGLISYVRLTWQTSPGEERTTSISRYQGKAWASVGSSAFEALCK